MLLLEVVLIISIVLQLSCAFLALRLIKITGYIWGWFALAVAIILMAVRRAVSFYSFIVEGESTTLLSTEFIALAISLLMFIGIINIQPILRYLYSQKSNLERLNAQLKEEIEQRKKAQEKTIISEEKFKKLADYAPVLIWMSDQKGQCTYFNERWLKFRGRTLEEEKGMGWTEGLHPEDKEQTINQYLGAFKKRQNFTLEYRIKNKDNQYRWFYDIGAPMYDDNDSFLGYIGSCIDLTERNKIEQELKESRNQLKKLSSYQQNLIEQERSYIAREIHDELGQYLSAIHMGLSWIKKQIDRRDRKMRSKILELIELTNVTLQKVKQLATELHPSIIDDMGILSAIEWYVNEFEKQSKISCYLYLPDNEVEIGIDENKAINIYRIIQEALNNVYRHAEASKVEVSMKQNEKEITLEIKDNGIGFDLSENQATDNLGVIGMKERAFIMNATFSIKGDKGSGTQVTIKIPIK
ncbi:MAG: PAS domain S-box protein [Bacteroidales bacterium]